MIEVVSFDRCTGCELCIKVCPTNVFDADDRGRPLVTRLTQCQTCFLCEAYCPADALFVAPSLEPAPAGSFWTDEAALDAAGLLGAYRRQLGWGVGRHSTSALDQDWRFYGDASEHLDPLPAPIGPAPELVPIDVWHGGQLPVTVQPGRERPGSAPPDPSSRTASRIAGRTADASVGTTQGASQ